MPNKGEYTNFIWSIADLLRGDYKQSDYGKVILPFTVLRRLDCVLEPTKQAVLDSLPKLKSMKVKNIDPLLNKITKLKFHNISQYNFEKLKADPAHIASNLRNYINGFSAEAREIMEYFDFDTQIAKLEEANLLYLIIEKFHEVDFHEVTSEDMGDIFENLIRRFSELSNETAGEHFTPREVIKLMVNLLFINDREMLTKQGIVKTLYDPACGTGGMLSVSEEYIRELNKEARLEVFGQEINPESYAICKSDMLIKKQNTSNIKFGNTFPMDGLENKKFDYMLSNPPFGVDWKKYERCIKDEHEKRGFGGRFGAGYPRISDGSFLFLQHMISKMTLANGGSRIGIVFNGSPLFSGGAGSGESEIRRWIIENDMLEAIIALPDQLFYNTGISTYIWIVTNRKPQERKGKIQFINAVKHWIKKTPSLGNKRHEISDNHISDITRIYGDFNHDDKRTVTTNNGEPEEITASKIFDNEDFGYHRITVERPLKLNFQVSPQRLNCFKEEKAFQNLAKSNKKGEKGQKEIEEGRQLQQKIISILSKMDSSIVYKNRERFTTILKKKIKSAGITIKSPVFNTILKALSQRDETAHVCLDSKGEPVPDSALRDYENVPLKKDIEIYFSKEVLPHVPDAWINHEKTKIGYELNFTKEFYVYKPLRPLKDIRADILALEQETEGMLDEVLKQ